VAGAYPRGMTDPASPRRSPPDAVGIRHGRESDLPALTELYNHYIRTTAITFDVEPYTVETRRGWFAGFRPSGRHQIFVADDAGRVVGFACTRPFRDKAAYATTVETSVYLEPAARGAGLGRRLYAALFTGLIGVDVHRAVAGVTLPNDASVALHERVGFRRVGVFHEVGRKLGRYWDVLWMERALGATEELHAGGEEG
jgi:phosphinothricin acetyltransferase